ncbi:glycoside hydrolase family 43 protein [Lysobacter arvi]|uniref:Glycoside hydrolase family 43 protein n=1 Tax=Lysobacter arvi TaxID=3038776 RepID=A0ABU1CGN7_9GAMM|nr:glycoside hydrolase family 43 protein [Lysobacter arvi]MDR0184082.1 glycoside hydrolase family 43 protein [Lysobacter arvi]
MSVLVLAAAALPALAAEPVLFDWFEYKGHDAPFDAPLKPGQYRNPILAGFYPDPSITRAGDRYYLVNSTFTWFPGIPVFESRDLVHWTQIGHVIDRPTQLDFDGLGMSRGVFAPTIEYHDGTFYVLNTSVDAGGNFIATAKNPAGPWSDPIWLKTIDGIDPSLFFDDGKVYLINNDAPEGTPLYEGHRAIWMTELDPKTLQPVGPRKVLINGGMDISQKPIWIEGPHIYKRDGWYYLVCAEGGTSLQHSQVVARSRDIWGPYTPYEHNPILTQRDLPEDRANAIGNAGHADLVQATDGTWWTVFLASRMYGRVHYNTGRETFLLPVEWKDGWPTILAQGKRIPQVADGPSFMQRNATQAPLSGNFTWRDDFDRPQLDTTWMFARVPKTQWADLRSHAGKLAISPGEGLDTLRNPTFLARRQQHLSFEASTSLTIPADAKTEAGLAAFQNETHWFAAAVRRTGDRVTLTLRKRQKDATTTLASTTLPATTKELRLKVQGNDGNYAFAYDAGNGWTWLKQDVDGTVLSTDVAGGFIGATVGPYARIVQDY